MTVRVSEINNLDSTLVLYNRAYYQVQCSLNYKLPVRLETFQFAIRITPKWPWDDITLCPLNQTSSDIKVFIYPENSSQTLTNHKE